MYDIKQIKQFKYFNSSNNNEHLDGDDKGRENGSQDGQGTRKGRS